MTHSKKHVLFYCDDCELLYPVIQVFSDTQPGIEIQTSSDIDDLIEKVRMAKPGLIVIYLHDPGQTYSDVLKVIRGQEAFSSIEVIIYRKLPDKKELEQAFGKSLSKNKRLRDTL